MEKNRLLPENKKNLFRPVRNTSLLALSSCALVHLTCSLVSATPVFSWSVVVNNGNVVPGTESQTFFSYNAPSINDAGTVVFRARAKMPHGGEEYEGGNEGGSGKGNASGGEHEGGGHSSSCGMEIGVSSGGASESEMVHGIFSRGASSPYAPIITIATRGDKVPQPNNMQGTNAGTFNSFPSFPRIDAESETLAFRAQSKPSYQYSEGGETIKSGTSGLYVTPYGGLLTTAIRNIESGSGFTEYLVPGTGTRFEQFPGSPSTTGNFITFKGNWSGESVGMTGVYYRDITGKDPVYKIAQRGDLLPEEAVPKNIAQPVYFGSTAPPSAAAGKVVFTGLDNEESPTAGGIFMAKLQPNPNLTTVAGFNTVVPKKQNGSNGGPTLNAFGEALSYDGRYVGFWAGWGMDTFSKMINCPSDGNSALSQACWGGSIIENDVKSGKYQFEVKKNQGIFLADTLSEEIFLVAETGEDTFSDFLFWNYSGNPEKGEGAQWRSSAYLAVDGNNIVFKAESAESGETGLYGAFSVTDLFAYKDIITILETGMDGGLLDPYASGLEIVALGIERDGFRNGRLAIASSMTNGDESWAGIYTTSTVPEPATMALFAIGLGGLGLVRRRNK